MRAPRPLAASLAGGAVLLGLSAFGLGCRTDRTEWRTSLAGMRAERLVGLWAMELRLDRATGDTLPQRVARGQIALTLNEERLDGPGFDGPPMYFGTFDIGFEPLGSRAVLQPGVPTLMGMLRAGDTLELKLAPKLPQRVTLIGVLDGDSVRGRWRATQPRGIDAVGAFLLRRR